MIGLFTQWMAHAPKDESFGKSLIRSAVVGVAIGAMMGLVAYGLTILTYNIKCGG